MATYDLKGHAMLDGIGLSGGLLEANQIMAESLLELDSFAHDGAKGELAKVAIITQIRFMQSEGVDLSKFAEISRKSRKWVASASALAGVSPVAERLAQNLRAAPDDSVKQAPSGFNVIRTIT